MSHEVSSHSNALCHGGHGSIILRGSGGTGVYEYNVLHCENNINTIINNIITVQ